MRSLALVRVSGFASRSTLAHMTFIPAFSGDPKRAEEARDKIRAARTFARRAPASPEMLAWLDAVEAEAETRFGDTRKALQLIRHGEETFANEEPPPSPAWLDWFSPVRLAGFKGTHCLWPANSGWRGKRFRRCSISSRTSLLNSGLSSSETLLPPL